MKKVMILTVTLLIVAFFVTYASAQGIVAKGLKGGINMANVRGEDIEEANIEIKLGFAVGGFITYQVNEQFAFQPEIYYASKGFKVKTKHYDSATDFISMEGTVTLNYLEIPVLGVFSVYKNLNLFAGPYFDIYLNGKEKSTIEIHGDYDPDILALGGSHTEDIKSEDINSPGYGLIFGAEYLIGKISIGARYSLGLSTIPDEEDVDVKHKLIQFVVGFHLP